MKFVVYIALTSFKAFVCEKLYNAGFDGKVEKEAIARVCWAGLFVCAPADT